jgi:hypothetical protein
LPVVWGGIVSLVQTLITTGAFGAKFPELCPDGHSPVGTDEKTFSLAIQAELPGLAWPLATTRKIHHGFWIQSLPFAPETPKVMDFIEFCYRAVAKPVQGSHHEERDHYHLTFDEMEGKKTFSADINRIFSRNNLAFELNETGQVVKLDPRRAG